jgi:hypothetical protein
MTIEGEKENQYNSPNAPIETKESEETHQNSQETTPIVVSSPSLTQPAIATTRTSLVRSVKKPTDYHKLANPETKRASSRYNAEVEAERRRVARNVDMVEEEEVEEVLADPDKIVAYAYMAEGVNDHVPKTIRDARSSPDWKEWLAAMKEEYQQLIEMGAMESLWAGLTEWNRRTAIHEPDWRQR